MAAVALTFPQPIALTFTDRILLVDDSPIFREALRREFEEDGWDVWEAADGPIAIQKAQQLRPPVILLDLAMPGMNGIAAARVLREALPDVHLILLTGYGYLFKSTELSSIGIDAIVSKNEPIAELLLKARSFLRARSVLKRAQVNMKKRFGINHRAVLQPILAKSNTESISRIGFDERRENN